MFYMTPQTLMNDLLRGNCDPSRIILLVIGERLSPADSPLDLDPQ